MGEIILPPKRGQGRPASEDARTKVQRVFRYLLELHRIKAPPLVHWDAYEWRLDLGKIAHHPGVRRGEAAGGDDDVVLRVRRPDETECPRPTVMIENWLKAGWDQVGAEPAVHETRKIRTGGEAEVAERFEDSEARVDAYEEWLAARRAWEAKEREVVDSLALFSDLFELWGRFARESEKYQLYLADGILVAQGPEGPVAHPLLLQRVALDFDAAVPEFILRESPESPEIYAPLLRHLGCDGKELLAVRESVRELRPHPLERTGTSAFLKDIVHRFWEDGQYFEHPDLVAAATGPYLYRQPTILLGHRNHGFAESLERTIEAFEDADGIPESLRRIVGVVEARPAEGESAAPPVDLLLTKDANPEQEEVIRRLAAEGAVLVQGPPGTGKSHTIANLIGHLLAEDKTILVTSHASKALRVVREKVAEPLQPLCVSLLDSDEESSKQLEESITGIVNVLSSTNPAKLAKEIDKVREKRGALRAEREALRGALLAAIAAEYEPVEVGEERADPATIARRLSEGVGRDDWLPGPVGPTPPFGAEAAAELYALNALGTPEDEVVAGAPHPDPRRLPEPKAFAAHFDAVARLEAAPTQFGAEYWRPGSGESAAIEALRAALPAIATSLADEEPWVHECIVAGREGAQRREAWSALVRAIEHCRERIPALEELVRAHGPRFREMPPNPEAALRTVNEIIDQLQAGEKLGGVVPEFRPEWQRFVAGIVVDEGEPRRIAHFQAIRNAIEIAALREELRRRWDRQMGPAGGPGAETLGEKPEERAGEERLRAALDWHARTWQPFAAALAAAGFDEERFRRGHPAEPKATGEVRRLRALVGEELPSILASRAAACELAERRAEREAWSEHLGEFGKSDPAGGLAKQFAQAIKRRDFDAYAHAWRRLGEIIERAPAVSRRAELLAALGGSATELARAIAAREAPHAAGSLPGDFLAAWRFRHWQQALAARHEVDLDALQKELGAVDAQLHEATAAMVEKLAWAAQLERTGLPQQQALHGWLALHKKIGRGTGKNVARLREEAQKVLAECRQAVPVWIMPLSRVMESFDIATTRFDVVILDEASQNDVIGLVALAMGREAVVVGDHEQVSPYAVGYDADRIQALIDEILVGIPNPQLYDGKTSVYDLARQSFGGTIRLLEHFRCVPDIIQFSNHLCYGGEIRPLRERSASRLVPHLVAHRVPRGRADDKVNPVEATEIASLVVAVTKLPEYEGATIGVISMVGTEQALHIDAILRAKLSVAEYQRRRLLCGNASQFQGDERDVIFLSMVDSPKDKPLVLRRRDEARKVFNVAASRARDQLWVVHSLDPGHDLKPGDLRLELISHAMDPTSLVGEAEPVAAAPASAFEEQLYRELSQAGYRTTLRFPVGNLPIDIVVEGADGGRIAILCEGDQSEPPEDIIARMERPMVLERLGWTFTRLRASEVLIDPARAMRDLARRLKGAGIEPVGNDGAPAGTVGAPASALTPDPSPAGAETPLLAKVLAKAEQIRTRWQESAGAIAARTKGEGRGARKAPAKGRRRN